MGLFLSDERLEEIISGRAEIVAVSGSQQTSRDTFAGYVLPGSFDPLHIGHREMADHAAQRFECPAGFEISIQNVDKSDLSGETIRSRLEQFQTDDIVYLTRSPKFVEKARLFDRPRFIVGADTILRIGDTKYYANDEKARDSAIDRLRDHAARFLVFGRLVGGKYESGETLVLPEDLRKLCDFVPEDDFRRDISSSELRR